MTILHFLAHTFAPWKSLYSDSTVLSTTITTIHIVALLIGGGIAIAADRTTLRALRHEDPDWQYHLEELHAVHRPVLAMLMVMFVSGVAMATADIETFAASVMFWVKLSLVALLVLNGLFVYNTESRLAATRTNGDGLSASLSRRLRLSASLSLGLWVLTAIAGTVLANTA